MGEDHIAELLNIVRLLREDEPFGHIPDSIESHTQALKAEIERLRAREAELVGALQELVVGDAVLEQLLFMDVADHTVVNLTLPLGNLRRARSVLTAARQEPS